MKFRPGNIYLLLASVVLMTVLCICSIGSPIRFQNEREQREVVVKTRLLRIRAAEERYRQQHGVYTGSFETLCKGRYLADSLRWIPFADNKPFDIAASTVMGKSGRQIPVMQCCAGYETYLHNLDRNALATLIEEASAAGKYAGLKIGDLSEPNNNRGNWE